MNAFIPIDVIFSGITINDVRDTQLKNTFPGNSVIVNPNGILAVNKDVQLKNNAGPITFIVSGKAIDFKDVHPENAEPSSCVILGINVTLSKLTHPAKAP